MENKLSSEKLCELSKIWQRVLKREHIGIQENFFELGGDPWLAIELFRDIERVFGRVFPPLVIYQAPTIASLAALLEAPTSPPFPKCVLLRAGSLGPPVFITHGLGGNIMELFDFVNHLQCDHAIYGLQERGTDGLEEPCTSIEEMAHFHVETIRKLEPVGPYTLIGYSFGGLVALEMARHLTEKGGRIALLVMIDAYPSLCYAPLLQRLGVYSRRVRDYCSLKRQSLIRKVHRLAAQPERTSNRIHNLTKNVENRSPLGVAFTPAMQRVQQGAAQALRSYQPHYYAGCIRFLKAACALHFPDDPEKVWAKLTDRFEVESVPGNHHELLTKHHENIAKVISRYLGDLSAGTLVESSD
jgi:acetoacetyl-CoA synthetase